MAKAANSDDEVAALYQLPPGEFTAARNALAKKLGPAAGDVRTLEKPQAAAWAVNQLYWQRRAAYDGLIRAAQGVRTAHTNMLSGRKADVSQAEGTHRDAMRAATQAIRELAQAAGESLSAGTMDAVAETLRALPSSDPPGQLSRPLKPLGFGALLNIEVKSAARVAVSGPARRSAEREGGARKETAENVKQRKVLEKALKVAETAEREAESALAEARKAVKKVERDYEAVRDRLTFLEKQRSDAEQEAHKRARELQTAANARTQAAQDLQRFT